MGGRIVRMADLEIDPAEIDAYKALLAEEIEASVRLEPGVLMLHAVSIDETPEKVRLLEVYADEAAYQAHLATPHFLKYKTLTASMVRSLRLLPVTPIRMDAK
ncbi:putative quinol monooxygenase [Shinella sp. M27]|uniref:putative quinol monooxygenase n=1 Tax=Shinella sp. M27 TaxID=3368614 RepID=UPI003BA00388